MKFYLIYRHLILNFIIIVLKYCLSKLFIEDLSSAYYLIIEIKGYTNYHFYYEFKFSFLFVFFKKTI